MEAELITLDTTYLEAEWLKNLISKFSILYRSVPFISIHTDSISTIELLKQVNANKKLNRHIQIRVKLIKCLMGKIIILDFVKSEKMLLTILLIKGLSRSVILGTSREMGLSS